MNLLVLHLLCLSSVLSFEHKKHKFHVMKHKFDVNQLNSKPLFTKISKASKKYENALDKIRSSGMQQIPKTTNQCESAIHKYKMYMKIKSKNQAWCKLEKTQYIRHRHGLCQGTLLKNALKSCASFYNIMHVNWDNCDYFCRKLKCLADIGNVVDVNLATQITRLRGSCNVSGPCETTPASTSAATSLRRNQRKNKSTITFRFAKKTTNQKYLMADDAGSLKFYQYKKENSGGQLQTSKQTVYFQFKYFDDYSIIPLLEQSRHRNHVQRSTSIIETLCNDTVQGDRLKNFERRDYSPLIACPHKQALVVYCAENKPSTRKVYLGYEVDTVLIMRRKLHAHFSLLGKVEDKDQTVWPLAFSSIARSEGGFIPSVFLLPKNMAGRCNSQYLSHYSNKA